MSKSTAMRTICRARVFDYGCRKMGMLGFGDPGAFVSSEKYYDRIDNCTICPDSGDDQK